MRIEVTGQLEGHPVKAAWIDGDLSGDAPLVASIEEMVAGGARVSIPGVINLPPWAVRLGKPRVLDSHGSGSVSRSCIHGIQGGSRPAG